MNPKTARFVLSAWILGFCLMVSLPLHAQVVGATLSGTVSDQSGGVVPQAAISIKNIATDITHTSTTSTAGLYSVPNLLPGTYEVRASTKGFSTELQTGINCQFHHSSGIAPEWEKLDGSGGSPAGRHQHPDPGGFHCGTRPRQARLWKSGHDSWGSPSAEQLPAGWRHHQ